MTTAAPTPTETTNAKPEIPATPPATLATALTTTAPAQAATPIRTPDTAEGTVDAFASMAKFKTAQEIAKQLAASTLVPNEYRNNMANCLVAIEVASRIGASVFAVIQNIDIIHGRPSWRATFLIATVNACGRFTPLRFRWQGTEGKSDWGCRAVAKDRESGEECLGSLITIALATAEGWATKSGSKWRTMPEQMLMYRAAAFWTRVYAPDLSLGMRTSDEEEDIGIPGVAAMPTAVSVNPESLEAQLRARSGSTATNAVAEAVIEEPAKAETNPAKVETKTAEPETKPRQRRTREADPETGSLPLEPQREPGSDDR